MIRATGMMRTHRWDADVRAIGADASEVCTGSAMDSVFYSSGTRWPGLNATPKRVYPQARGHKQGFNAEYISAPHPNLEIVRLAEIDKSKLICR